MTVTVLAITETDVSLAAPLSTVMNERLKRLAAELQKVHLKELESVEPLMQDIVVYMSYNSKYNIRWKIVNDVPDFISQAVADQCDKLGYIRWKTSSLYNFNIRK
ncbi:hypothetical protein PBAL39_17694 [Pedobacter sp. BAL39]|uniref:hypothetical protein n=1 Tax=Pedobacter sp. BAL39 TaxID=391596 RepID=UPI0001559BDE|nr:hypothetical protein [Pedobacter sp. BAL39]EDM36731.1 hypothetical protein PBAL39_17694 [Pedobacter sp. BAL39]